MTRNDLPRLSRREMLKLSAAGVGAFSISGWMDTFAADAAKHPQRKKAVILLWMNGGPSTIDLWDLKPGHKNGGPFKEIQTDAPGLKIGEHLPKVAKFGKKMAIIRSMSTTIASTRRSSASPWRKSSSEVRPPSKRSLANCTYSRRDWMVRFATSSRRSSSRSSR